MDGDLGWGDQTPRIHSTGNMLHLLDSPQNAVGSLYSQFSPNHVQRWLLKILSSRSSSQWAGSSFLDRIVRGLCCLFLNYQLSVSDNSVRYQAIRKSEKSEMNTFKYIYKDNNLRVFVNVLLLGCLTYCNLYRYTFWLGLFLPPEIDPSHHLVSTRMLINSLVTGSKVFFSKLPSLLLLTVEFGQHFSDNKKFHKQKWAFFLLVTGEFGGSTFSMSPIDARTNWWLAQCHPLLDFCQIQIETSLIFAKLSPPWRERHVATTIQIGPIIRTMITKARMMMIMVRDVLDGVFLFFFFF